MRKVDANAWLAYGGRTTSNLRRPAGMAAPACAPLPGSASWTMRSDYLATTEEVRKLSRSPKDSGGRLVDVRKRGEYNGTLTRSYPFLSKAGHIPNALLQGDWVNLIDLESHKIAPTLEVVRRRWLDLGIVDADVQCGETTLIFYCGTGWRSSLSFLVATLLGYRARNYDDGFYGWSWDDANPIELVDPT